VDIMEMIQEWQVGVRIFHAGHSKAAAHYSRMHRWLGIPVIILTAVVGTTAFATLESATSLLIQILVGMLSVSASVLAGVQTFLNFAERSDRHRAAALKYGALRRQIEVALATGPGENTTLRDFTEAFRGEWDTADKEAPVLPQRFFGAASNQVGRSMEAARRRKEKEENGGAGA